MSFLRGINSFFVILKFWLSGNVEVIDLTMLLFNAMLIIHTSRCISTCIHPPHPPAWSWPSWTTTTTTATTSTTSTLSLSSATTTNKTRKVERTLRKFHWSDRTVSWLYDSINNHCLKKVHLNDEKNQFLRDGSSNGLFKTLHSHRPHAGILPNSCSVQPFSASSSDLVTPMHLYSVKFNDFNLLKIVQNSFFSCSKYRIKR
jgi:hypothetical protein